MGWILQSKSFSYLLEFENPANQSQFTLLKIKMFGINSGAMSSYLGKRVFGNNTLTQNKKKKYASKVSIGTKTQQGSKGTIDKSTKYSYKKIRITPEKKHAEVYVTQSSFSGQSTGALVNGISQGVQQYERVGQEVISKSIQCRGKMVVPSNITVPVTYRLLIVQDKQCNGATPALSDILHDVSTDTRALMSPYKLANRQRFRILWDHTDTLDSGQGTSNVEIFFCNTGWKETFLSTSSAVTGISTNGLFFFTIQDNTLTGDFYFRHRYFDS